MKNEMITGRSQGSIAATRHWVAGVVTVFKALGPIDLRNMRRDSLLAWMPLAPLAAALLLRLGTPALAEFVHAQWNFDLTPYYGLIASSFLVLAPALVGMIVGFLLLDERDEGMDRALLVMPVRMGDVLLYRIGLPLGVGTLVTLLCYPLLGLASVPFTPLLIATLLAAVTAPLIALFLASFAENKVAGFAMMKLVNGLSLVPTVAYFLPHPWQWFCGIVPTYWPLKVFWLAAAGHDYTIYAGIGLFINGLALWLLLRRFQRVIHR